MEWVPRGVPAQVPSLPTSPQVLGQGRQRHNMYQSFRWQKLGQPRRWMMESGSRNNLAACTRADAGCRGWSCTRPELRSSFLSPLTVAPARAGARAPGKQPGAQAGPLGLTQAQRCGTGFAEPSLRAASTHFKPPEENTMLNLPASKSRISVQQRAP